MYVAPAPRFPLHTGGGEGGEPGADVAPGPGLGCFIYMQVQLSLFRMICHVRSSEEELGEVIPGSSTLLLQPVLLDHPSRLPLTFFSLMSLLP